MKRNIVSILMLIVFSCHNMAFAKKVNLDSVENLLPIRKGKLWGYVNAKGEIKIPLKYAGARVFSKYGLAKVYAGGYGGYDKKSGMIDKTGNEVIPIHDYYYLEQAGDSTICFAKPVHGERLYGLMDLKGNEIIQPTYRNPINFNFGIAIVETTDTPLYKAPPLYTAINKKGVVITKQKYAKISPFVSGFARVSLANESGVYMYGVIDTTGREVLPIIYDAIGLEFSEQFADSNTFKNNLIAAKLGGNLKPKWGVISMDNKVVLDFQYDYLSNSVDGCFIAGITRPGKDDLDEQDFFGCINIQNEKIVPFVYTSLRPFVGDLLIAKKKGKFGIINSKGKEILPFQYDSETYSDNNFVVVGKKKKGKEDCMIWGAVNYKGKEVIPTRFDDVSKGWGGYIEVELNGKKGMYDYEGKNVLPVMYTGCQAVKNGEYFIVGLKGDKVGMVDKNNEIVLQFKYDLILQSHDSGDGIFGVENLNDRSGSRNSGEFEFIGKGRIEYLNE